MSNTTRSKKSRAQTELLQKFNRHGMLVLDASIGGGSGRNVASAPAAENLEQKLQSTYHTQLASSLDLMDLSEEAPPSYNTLAIGQNSFAALGARKAAAVSAESAERFQAAVRAFAQELEQLPGVAEDGNKKDVYTPKSAEAKAILLELTSQARGMNKAAIAAKQLREEAGSQLIVFSTGEEPDMVLPDQFCDELKKRYHTCNELFRHFWSSLNARSAPKLARVHYALDEQHKLLQVIRSSLNSRGYGQLVPLLNPLVNSIETCAATYKKWQEKQGKPAGAPGAPVRLTNAAPPSATSAPPLAPTNSISNEPDSKRIKL